jgi:hypothetical protein
VKLRSELTTAREDRDDLTERLVYLMQSPARALIRSAELPITIRIARA